MTQADYDDYQVMRDWARETIRPMVNQALAPIVSAMIRKVLGPITPAQRKTSVTASQACGLIACYSELMLALLECAGKAEGLSQFVAVQCQMPGKPKPSRATVYDVFKGAVEESFADAGKIWEKPLPPIAEDRDPFNKGAF